MIQDCRPGNGPGLRPSGLLPEAGAMPTSRYKSGFDECIADSHGSCTELLQYRAHEAFIYLPCRWCAVWFASTNR
jgi:hypothetical protein